jgi:hypothetical protein
VLCWSGTQKNFPTSGRSQLSYLLTKRVIKHTVVIMQENHCCQLKKKSNNLLSKLIPNADESTGDRQSGFPRNSSMTDQILYRKYNGTVHKVFIALTKACVSVRREVLYIILTECGIHRKLYLHSIMSSHCCEYYGVFVSIAW